MDVRAPEAEGVDPHDAAPDRDWLVHHPQSAISQGRDVSVGTVEVQVGSPNTVLQRQHHLETGGGEDEERGVPGGR